jgi:hypothetical protein
VEVLDPWDHELLPQQLQGAPRQRARCFALCGHLQGGVVRGDYLPLLRSVLRKRKVQVGEGRGERCNRAKARAGKPTFSRLENLVLVPGVAASGLLMSLPPRLAPSGVVRLLFSLLPVPMAARLGVGWKGLDEKSAVCEPLLPCCLRCHAPGAWQPTHVLTRREVKAWLLPCSGGTWMGRPERAWPEWLAPC